ncbi:MAG: hypothetical protein WA810_05375 [Maribacter sp.]
MKKLLSVLGLFLVLIIASCDYDDSNDIDYLTPNDSTDAKVSPAELPN